MGKFGDMSRDELISTAKGLRESLLSNENHPAIALCPFCRGDRMVPLMKCLVKPSVYDVWQKNVTQEEWDAYVLATYGPAKT